MNHIYDNIPSFEPTGSTIESFSTMPNIDGGVDAFGPTGNLIGSATPNISGGHDFTTGGQDIHSASNINGGQDFFDNSGELFQRTEENIFGGHNFYDSSNELVGSSNSNIFGGQDFTAADGEFVGSSMENIHGGMDYEFDLGDSLTEGLGAINDLGGADFAVDGLDLGGAEEMGDLFDLL